jgi:hypothetical protein
MANGAQYAAFGTQQKSNTALLIAIKESRGSKWSSELDFFGDAFDVQESFELGSL